MEQTRKTASAARVAKSTTAAKAAKRGGILVALLTAGVVVAACSSSADPVAAKPTCGGSSPKLTVQGTGLTTGTPNLLTVSVGIDVTDPTATSAITDDNTKAQAV